MGLGLVSRGPFLAVAHGIDLSVLSLGLLPRFTSRFLLKALEMSGSRP